MIESLIWQRLLLVYQWLLLIYQRLRLVSGPLWSKVIREQSEQPGRIFSSLLSRLSLSVLQLCELLRLLFYRLMGGVQLFLQVGSWIASRGSRLDHDRNEFGKK